MTFKNAMAEDHKVFDNLEEFGIVANVDGVDIEATLQNEEITEFGQFIYRLSFDATLATLTDTSVIIIDGISYLVLDSTVKLGRTFASMEKQ